MFVRKLSIFALLAALALLISCSRNAPVIEKKVVAPAPEVYNVEKAMADLDSIDESTISKFTEKVAKEFDDNSTWSEFWKNISWRIGSYQWSDVILLKLLDLGGYNCSDQSISSFNVLIQKILSESSAERNKKVVLSSLKHLKTCNIQASQAAFSDYLHIIKDSVTSQEVPEFLRYFSSVNTSPTNDQLFKIVRWIDNISEKDRLKLYTLLRQYPGYKTIAKKLIASFSFKETMISGLNKALQLDHVLEVLELTLFQLPNLTNTEIELLFNFIQYAYENTNTELELFNISNFHYRVLSVVDKLEFGKSKKFIYELEKWASYIYDNYDDIVQFYPANSLPSMFAHGLKSSSSTKIDLKQLDSSFEILLAMRANISIESSPEIALELNNLFCKKLSNYGIENQIVSSVEILNTIGCKKLEKNEKFVITTEVRMPILSSFTTNGNEVYVEAKPKRLSIINTSRGKEFEDLPAVTREKYYDNIVIPIVIGFSPLVSKGRFKKGTTHYIAANHIYRDARALVPGLENVKQPLDGKKAGDLFFREGTVSNVTLIALGGEGQKAAPGKPACPEYIASFDELKVRSWVESFDGNQNFYFSDNFKTLRNLRNLIESATDENNKLNVYIDLDYINILSAKQQAKLIEDMETIKKVESLGQITDSEVLEIIARRSVRKFLEETKDLELSKSLESITPEIFSEIIITAGNVGEVYPDGRRGQNGQILIK